MIDACKFCGKSIPKPELGEDYWCIHCRHYSIVMDYDSPGIVESESLRVGNYYLHFFPTYKEATVVETRDEQHRIIHKLTMDELTQERAEHWVKKLKTYVLFQ